MDSTRPVDCRSRLGQCRSQAELGVRGYDLPSIDSSLSITTDFDDVVLPDVDEIQAIRLDAIHDTLEIIRRLEFRRQAILGEVSA